MKKRVEKMIEEGETELVEFKESLNLKDEIGECASAFSNTNGGVILIGVADTGEIKGVQLGNKSIEEIANHIKQNTDNSVYTNIEKIDTGDKTVLAIKIKENEEKPIFFRGKAYIRVGKSTHKLSASEIRKLAKNSYRVYWDEQVCKDARLNDLDKDKIKWYLEQREKHRNISKEIKISFNSLLQNTKAVKNEKPTNAGILFFGRKPLNFISQAQLRIIRIKGKEIGGVILDRLDCNGALWEMVGQAEEFFKKHINFIGIRTEKSFQREDKFDIPLRALRELVINALIHRDYETTADVRIFIFDNRVEIVNPGSFPEGVTPKKPLHKPVNKLLSEYMYDIGFVEKYGSGIIFVRNLLKDNGNRDLEYVLNNLETKAIVFFHSNEKGIGRVGEKVGEKVGENQSKILDLIKENKYITYVELSKKLSISKKGIYQNVEKLKQKGLLKRIGPDKGGYWKISNN